MDKKAVYIAGPYTAGDPVSNTRDACEVFHRLADLGCYPFCPHIDMLLHFHKERSWDFWLDQCLVWVSRCDALLRMPGESRGADMEISHAESLKIPVFRSYSQVAEWLNTCE